MTEKMIRVLQFTYRSEAPDPSSPDGTFLHEHLGRLGEVVEIPRDSDVDLGVRHDAFYSDEDRAAIEDGTYTGFDAEVVYAARQRLGISRSVAPPPDAPQDAIPVGGGQPGDVARPDLGTASSSEVADYIKNGRSSGGNIGLNVQDTVALANNPDGSPNADYAELILDAENEAMENVPRQGVVRGLEAAIAQATSGSGNGGGS